MRAPTGGEVAAGDVLLSVENVSLAFGGVRAIRDVSFDIRKGEIRAIIGPNGAGKTSMLNVINGFYHPQQGVITFKGRRRHDMRPYLAASQGIARTFQNVALFKGMSTLDNIMTGRTLKMRRGILAQAIYWGASQREEYVCVYLGVRAKIVSQRPLHRQRRGIGRVPRHKQPLGFAIETHQAARLPVHAETMQGADHECRVVGIHKKRTRLIGVEHPRRLIPPYSILFLGQNAGEDDGSVNLVEQPGHCLRNKRRDK